MTFQSPSSGLAEPAAYTRISVPPSSNSVSASAVAVNDAAATRLARYTRSTSPAGPSQAISVLASCPIVIAAPETFAGPVKLLQPPDPVTRPPAKRASATTPWGTSTSAPPCGSFVSRQFTPSIVPPDPPVEPLAGAPEAPPVAEQAAVMTAIAPMARTMERWRMLRSTPWERMEREPVGYGARR